MKLKFVIKMINPAMASAGPKGRNVKSPLLFNPFIIFKHARHPNRINKIKAVYSIAIFSKMPVKCFKAKYVQTYVKNITRDKTVI